MAALRCSFSLARALASAGGINAYGRGWVRAPPRSLTDTGVVQSLTIAILAFHLALSARPVPLSRRDLRLLSSGRLAAAGSVRLLPRRAPSARRTIHSRVGSLTRSKQTCENACDVAAQECGPCQHARLYRTRVRSSPLSLALRRRPTSPLVAVLNPPPSRRQVALAAV